MPPKKADKGPSKKTEQKKKEKVKNADLRSQAMQN